MTIPPTVEPPREEAPREAPKRVVPVITLSASAPTRPHIATEEEIADERRLDGMRAHWVRKPWVTWILLAANAAMFVLEESLGGSENSDVLIRLGALVPGEVMLGAWWRLISSGFLHAGIVHVALNSYVLWIVGSTLERTLGPARFLVAYTVSLLVASLASLALSDADLTVGASGAVFGLFGVEAIVVFLRPELLPTHVRQTHARNVLINLVINVAMSFQPNIATVAHFGGGLAGAAVGFFLVPFRFPLRPETPRWASALAIACSLLLASGVGRALFEATRTTGHAAILHVM